MEKKSFNCTKIDLNQKYKEKNVVKLKYSGKNWNFDKKTSIEFYKIDTTFTLIRQFFDLDFFLKIFKINIFFISPRI